jgi:hypothetical protein
MSSWVSRWHLLAMPPPQQNTWGRSVCTQVPCPAGSLVVSGHSNALPGASQSPSNVVLRSHAAGAASGFAQASSFVSLHERQEPISEPSQRTQRSASPQLSSLTQPGRHSSNPAEVDCVSQYWPAEHVPQFVPVVVPERPGFPQLPPLPLLPLLPLLPPGPFAPLDDAPGSLDELQATDARTRNDSEPATNQRSMGRPLGK